MASISEFKKHAKRYGTEGVMNAAIELGYDFDALCDLQAQLDAIDADHARAKRFGVEKRHRLTVETRVRRLLGLPDDETEDSLGKTAA